MTDPIPFQNWSLTQEQLLAALGDEMMTLGDLTKKLVPSGGIDQDLLDATITALLTTIQANGMVDSVSGDGKTWYLRKTAPPKAPVNTDADLDQVWSAFKSLLRIAGQEIENGYTLEGKRVERNLLLKKLLSTKVGP